MSAIALALLASVNMTMSWESGPCKPLFASKTSRRNCSDSRGTLPGMGSRLRGNDGGECIHPINSEQVPAGTPDPNTGARQRLPRLISSHLSQATIYRYGCCLRFAFGQQPGRPTPGTDRRPSSTALVDARRCPRVARPGFPTSVILAQGLPSRRRGRESSLAGGCAAFPSPTLNSYEPRPLWK